MESKILSPIAESEPQSKSIKLSIIVSTVNCLALTKEFVSSFEEHKPKIPLEVIVIDNASCDGTQEYLSELKNHYKVIQLENRRNFATNANHGATVAVGEILLFLNNDVVLTQGWFDSIMQVFEDNTRVGLVGNIQINPATQLIDHAGIAFDLDGVLSIFAKTEGKYLGDLIEIAMLLR